MVPPISLVPQALYHARICICKVILVVPMWSSSPFWPIIKNEYAYAVKDLMVVKGEKVLEQGMNKNSIFGSNSFKGNVLALKLDFNTLSR